MLEEKKNSAASVKGTFLFQHKFETPFKAVRKMESKPRWKTRANFYEYPPSALVKKPSCTSKSKQKEKILSSTAL